MPDLLHSALVVAAGAAAAGFAQGVKDFAFSIVAPVLGLGAAAADHGAARGFRRLTPSAGGGALPNRFI
jgi:hypothetical protein